MKAFGYLLILLVLIFTAGCKSSSTPEESEAPMSIQISSPAFSEGGSIPKQYTCDGANTSPALNWSGVPAVTKSLALIVDDPDAPSGDWVHWVVFNLPAAKTGLLEGAGSATGEGVQGINDFRKSGYGGPCPPKGPAHRYFFRLYALDATLSLKEGATKADVVKAMKDHVLAQGQFMGKYGR